MLNLVLIVPSLAPDELHWRGDAVADLHHVGCADGGHPGADGRPLRLPAHPQAALVSCLLLRRLGWRGKVIVMASRLFTNPLS